MQHVGACTPFLQPLNASILISWWEQTERTNNLGLLNASFALSLINSHLHLVLKQLLLLLSIVNKHSKDLNGFRS